MLLKWAWLLGVSIYVSATSQGVMTTTCDPWANMGCTQWAWDATNERVNRLNCTDPTKGPMPWTTKPIRSMAFSVRTSDGPAGQDPTGYLPGAMITIYVRALKYSLPYRGLLLTAYDSSQKVVGGWTYPLDDQALFWSPPQCNQSAMHNSATIKPYLSLIRFVAPPSGTGTITIRALIKTGVANTGDFFYPFTDLVLQETYYEPAWFAANAGETCNACCLRNGRSGFDPATQAALFPAESFRVAVEKKVMCNLPLLSSCSAAAPVIDANNYCYMKESNCTPSWRSTTPVPNSRNLCACIVQSSASTMSISRWVLALLGLAALSSQKRHFFLYLFLACLLLPSAQAHNWLHTPGRASTQASTIFPCQGRKATDLHAQLSRTQDFTTKWAVGHDRNAYFVLIHEKDQDMLAQSNFEDMVDDYLTRGTKAPYNSINLANDDKWMRYHGTYTDPTPKGYFDTSKLPGSLFDSAVTSGANLLSHPRSNQTSWQLKYTTAARKDDIRLDYASTEYPWIEMAFRAPHLYHMPDDFNIFRTQVAGRGGDGHYILHWRWSGYFDCIDIDLRAASVTNVYGKDGTGFIFNRIDHCQYVEPNQIVTPCVEVTWNSAACTDRLPGWMTDYRLGVNVVPFNNPSSVYKGFQNQVNIPWSDGVCADNTWLRLSGTVTESAIDFNNANVFKTTKQTGVVCTSTMQRCNDGAGACSLNNGDYVPWDNQINFRRAIALCVGHRDCKGVSVQNDGSFPAGTIPTDTGTHTIYLCTSTATTSNSNFTSYFPSGLATYTDKAGAALKVYSFLPNPQNSLPAPLANNYRDYGEPYNAATMYGWKCNSSVVCPWCCSQYDCTGRAPSGNDPKAYGSFQYMQGICATNTDPKADRQWEVAVPKGIYEVTLLSNTGTNDPTAWISGCNIDGALMQDDVLEPAQPATILRRAEVTDGRLTLDGNAASEKGCNAVNWISFKQVRDQWDEAWYPPSANPWWQMKLDAMQPIGVVQIQASLNYYYQVGGNRKLNCAAWWMYRGSRCADGRPIGWFNASDEGVIVGVSNSSSACSGAGCTGVVCGALRQGVDEWSVGQQYIDCKGVVAQYVWVYLPGAARALIFNVQVSRSVPELSQPGAKVCYGVEARPQTATAPEFVISSDPEDPIFHSTCYSREKNISWLPTTPALGVSAPVPRWRFNQHCLDCATYHHNAQSLFSTEIPAPWTIADGMCANCDLEGNPPAIQKTKLKWLKTGRGSFAEDTQTCAANFECVKDLSLGGRGGADDWWQRVMDAIDCQSLVERDPDCHPVARYSRAWWDGSVFQPDGRSCQCWRKDACCGRPNVAGWGDAAQDGSEIYRAQDGVTPDPTCSSGIKSTDNTLCCPSYCKDDMGNSVCGWGTNPWGACYRNVAGGGTCCQNSTMVSCANTAAPCLL